MTKIFRRLLLLLSLNAGLLMPGSLAAELQLATEGKANYIISLATDAIPAERTAAEQLQRFLKEVTGADFVLRDEKDVPVEEQQIFVGAGQRARSLIPAAEWKDLGTDGMIIKTSKGQLILAGGRPRGTLYAVFQFLEESVGCRWWTPTESTIPNQPTLTVNVEDQRYVPPFSYREHFSTAMRYHPEFATKLHQNGSHQQQTEEWGGHFKILGFSHTFSELIPPQTYFGSHPEWFSDPTRGGLPCTKDSPLPEGQDTQLCLTNPEVLKELTKNALELIRQNPTAGYISISQNDNSNPCTCESCKKLATREGSQSGVILTFVNQVAKEIGESYPDFWVETLAYTYSEKPPRTVRPARNVLIRLALALADYGHPIDSEWNEPARDLIRNWAKIAPHLFIWSYATNFKKAMFPHPNWRSMAEDYRFFAANNVQGMFVQGDCYTGDVGDFTQLRAWLTGKLLWDPTRDQKALTSEFLAGYYGAAAPFLQQYLDLLLTTFEAQKRGLNTNNRDFSFINLDMATQGTDLFRQAREAVADQPSLLNRVRREELSLRIAKIARDRALRLEAKNSGREYASDWDAEIVQFTEDAKAYGLQMWGENISLEEGLEDLRKTANPPKSSLPDFAKNLPRELIIDFQPSMLNLAFEDSLTFIEDDPAASGGVAARMSTNSQAWLVQAQLGSHMDVPNEKWRIYAGIRYHKRGGVSPKGIALDGGVFDDSSMKDIARFSVDFSQVSDSDYRLVDLGVHTLTPGMLIWFAPHTPHFAEQILFERVLLVRETESGSIRP